MKLLLAAGALWAAFVVAPWAQATEPASPSVLCQDRPGYPHIEEFCDQKPGYWEPNDKVAQ